MLKLYWVVVVFVVQRCWLCCLRLGMP